MVSYNLSASCSSCLGDSLDGLCTWYGALAIALKNHEKIVRSFQLNELSQIDLSIISKELLNFLPLFHNSYINQLPTCLSSSLKTDKVKPFLSLVDLM